ncbi:hypothetical protein MNEG_4533 [Monoraphidium neglectum]|uniref:Cyclic nucleotide-binding domain-containing protein n=1 Tax=Monoraphidium neglectum TaxID=145388 RepID=A0A0D2NDP3_9CHLO|nr:hypothetical protein MNEG_4533 [Monoraphidium neglectum]KIZ03426.1 hypothetical protein MNEG_4533 [Monoraphidium neglectum]|eukprot:XP_013902445.1 hypothetical protein MNEG_4533 [Monoraphidium neglectum]
MLMSSPHGWCPSFHWPQEFLVYLGAHFKGLREATRAFLSSKVRAVREAGAPQAEVQRLSAIMLPGTAKAGRTWELAQEDQVYFVKDGSFQLELIEHATTAGSGSAAAGLKKIPWRSNTQQLQAATYAGTAGGADLGGRPQSSRPSTAPAASSGERGVARVSRRNAPGGGSGSGGNAGGGESENQQQPEDEGASTGGWGRDSGGARGRRVMPPLADCGVLASVRMAGGGRVVGTLGMEEELQRARLRGTVKKVVARLGPGHWFGGGAALIGEGPLQSGLRLVATSDAELWHVHVNVFMQQAGDAIIR